MIDLEGALTDLAEHLDHPDGHELADTVRDRITANPRHADRCNRRVRALVAVAAAAVFLTTAVVTIGPARQAVADWLGIGGVEIRQGQPVPTGANPVPGSPGPKRPPNASASVDRAQTRVQFHIATARGAGRLLGVGVDRRVPGGLVVLTYDRFTLVELASYRDHLPPVEKTVDPKARIEHVTVNGQPGHWISGAHEVAYLDRSGNFKVDTVRRSGAVLIWEHDGVTFRIEGPVRLAEATRIATTIR
ncbi:MAG: hypothetical protein JWL83_1154 [Actinomycetia bacterium]|nr:hypothetical protein [Actinomycetes bacterium]